MIERKYDGEYCEVHIDLSKGSEWLTIFSKSGKDSTSDRIALESILSKCLQLGTEKSRITGEITHHATNSDFPYFLCRIFRSLTAGTV